MKAVHEIIVLCTATVMLTAISASIIPQDFQLLKRLLQYKSTNAVSVRNTAPATLAVPITTTELSVIVAQTDNLPVMNDFYNTIYTGNRTVDVKLRQTISAAVPHLQKLAANRTDKLSKQRALVQLAVELQPLIGPIIRSYPNLTANITYPNKGPIINNFNRTARGGYGGGGWGWGGGCCEEPHVFVLEKGWGGDDHDGLLSYLLANKGGLGGNSDLNTLLPLLFGLIALLIMKLPT